jgi:hypothetical protein
MEPRTLEEHRKGLHFLKMAKPRASRVRSKSFIFTLNNPTEDEIQYVQGK